MKIIIPDDYQNIVSKLKCLELIKQFDVEIFNDTVKDTTVLAERFQSADVLVLIRERTKITEELLAKLPNLKLISQTGKISNHLDLKACSKYNIAVAEGKGSPIAPAELTWALIMNSVRKIPQAITDMKEGKWQTNIGRTINGTKIGIWGYGKIGKLIAKYAKAFGAEVIVWGSEESGNQAVSDGYVKAATKEEFFRTCDVISVHLRLTETTQGIIKEQDLKLMKPDAVFVNTSRAELVEQGALVNALESGNPGYAALDVFENEPVYDTNYKLLNMPQVICTPHLGYVELNSYEMYFSIAFENVLKFAAGNYERLANSYTPSS